MSFTETVQNWFKDQWGGSLLLPDGWTVVLDQKLTLLFEGLKSVKAQKRELIFGPFKKLRFDWDHDAESRTWSSVRGPL